MAETMTSLEIAYIEGLCETDGEGTVSLAEEDFERICAQAKRVPDLSTRLLAAERDAARLRELEQANTDLADENERLREGLHFYAHGMHYEGFGTWEGPSGDDNWLCPPTRDSSDYREFIDDLDQHMIEDGAVARCYLSGKRAEWEGDEPPEHPCEPVMKAIAEAEAEDRAALAGKQEEGR
jgi:hypothetical protein